MSVVNVYRINRNGQRITGSMSRNAFERQVKYGGWQLDNGIEADEKIVVEDLRKIIKPIEEKPVKVITEVEKVVGNVTIEIDEPEPIKETIEKPKQTRNRGKKNS